MQKRELITRLETEYLAKILGFSYQKVHTAQDAEELASDIVWEVVKSIYAGKQIDNLNAFIWSVSNHTFCKWLRSKRYGTTAYLPDGLAADINVEEACIQKEQINFLHREMALLAKDYRRCVVMHYFEGKNCADIARILGKSTGTIKWWLHEARRTLLKGMNTMRKYGKKSYNPEALFISCQGAPGADNEPISCAKRKLPQNILLAAYKEPLSIEQLCMELGTAAPYIEDEIDALVQNQLMKECPGGRYQTDFVILPGQNIAMAHNLYEACFPMYSEELLSFLERHKALLTSEALNTAGFSWERLLWVYIHMITDAALSKYKREVCKVVAYEDMPQRPNGGKWIALGFRGRDGDGLSNGEAWEAYIPFDGPVHKTGKVFAQGFFHYWSGLDSRVFFDIPDEVFALCGNIIKGERTVGDLDEEEKYLFSIAVEKRLFVQDEGGFRQNYYFVGRDQLKIIEDLASALYPAVLPLFEKAYQLVLKEYEDTVPKHLHWQMGNFLSNSLNNFVPCSLYEAFHEGKLSKPDEDNAAWLSLLAAE